MNTRIPNNILLKVLLVGISTQKAKDGLMVGNECVYELHSYPSRMGRGIIIPAASKVAGCVSDRLEFHHPGSGLSTIRMMERK